MKRIKEKKEKKQLTSPGYSPSSLQSYNFENGRRYHAYRDGSYMMPNDEKEQERLDLAHQIFKMLLRGHLHRARLPHAPRNVLDFGTGTGSWAIDFADIHPDSHVVGIDLSPIQPSNIPPNCRFFVDDIESPWTFESKFDFIHARAMSGSIRDWDTLLHQALENLNEDGVIELQEYEAVYRSDDGTLERTEAIRTWQRQLNEASERVGQPMNSVETLKARLEACGFVDVRDDVYKLPVGPWPKDRRLKELGYVMLFHCFEALEAFTLAPFTRVLGWTSEEMLQLMEGVKAELSSAQNHFSSFQSGWVGSTNLKDEEGRTALHTPCIKGRKEIVQMLIDNDADLEMQSLFLNNYAPIDDSEDDGETPLHWATVYGELEIVQLILRHHPNVDASDHSKETALHKVHECLVKEDRGKITEELLKKADIGAKCGKGQTALHKASEAGCTEIVEVLLDHPRGKRFINSPDDSSFTPLRLASMHGHGDTIEVLLHHRADVGTGIVTTSKESELTALPLTTGSLLRNETEDDKKNSKAAISHIAKKPTEAVKRNAFIISSPTELGDRRPARQRARGYEALG
ncbi:hypothetical protein ZTR_10469 [Talaromyces verruculosus]|nr:hypothetical protein ZTR_10469 [Talaromyces verruculosus]